MVSFLVFQSMSLLVPYDFERNVAGNFLPVNVASEADTDSTVNTSMNEARRVYSSLKLV